MLDWGKLKSYNNDKRRCFEEFCYQIAKTQFSKNGKFTSVDDSGGGDGVEFYIILPNGDEWGWQAKFFYPNQRLSVSNRKEQIKRSIKRACEVHPNLKKFFLCTPTNFTTDENNWFENKLRSTIPDSIQLEIIHWGDAEFNDFMSKPEFSGKRFYFFGELELTLDWFQNQYRRQISAVLKKIEPKLHVESEKELIISLTIGNSSYIDETIKMIEVLRKNFESILLQIDKYPSDMGKIYNNIRKEFFLTVDESIKNLKLFFDFLEKGMLAKFAENEFIIYMEDLKNSFVTVLEEFKLMKLGEKAESYQNIAVGSSIIRKFFGTVYELQRIFRNFSNDFLKINDSDLHIFGEAGSGKTHITFMLALDRLEKKLPVIFINGINFNMDQTIESQLLSLLDIPRSYSWNQFLEVLNFAGKVFKTRIPIIIDGLNESQSSSIWEKGLKIFINEISKFQNIFIITTCRSSYRNAIWGDEYNLNYFIINGFQYLGNLDKAVEKYFSFYKIIADTNTDSLEYFKNPLHLKIFCESQNPTRSIEKHIILDQISFYNMFDTFIEQCNKKICSQLGLYSKSTVLEDTLQKLAVYLLDNKSRAISLIKFCEIVDNEELGKLEWNKSVSKTILDEGLLICRDNYNNGEIVFFTYDLLAGYIISKSLIQNTKDVYHLVKFIKPTLFGGNINNLHPLHEDIGYSLAILLPLKKEIFLHELIYSENMFYKRLLAKVLPFVRKKYQNDLIYEKNAFATSINVIFELQPNFISEKVVKLISELLTIYDNSYYLFNKLFRYLSISNHPLNSNFLSIQLRKYGMQDRDTTWTEFIRLEYKNIDKKLEKFEENCKMYLNKDCPVDASLRLKLTANYIMWIQTSTIRSIRDKATKSLYWFGRIFPSDLFVLTISSLSINDPYIPERMLAASYGVILSYKNDLNFLNDFKQDLSNYGRKLFNLMFTDNALYSTTHIRSRDYAKRSIDIILITIPQLLTEDEKLFITQPFKQGGIRLWGEREDRNFGHYRDGNAPLNMDFMNYTLGMFVKNRANYDFGNKEYQKILKNVYWRIYTLGYSLEAFGEIDKEIQRLSFYKRNHRVGKIDRYGKKYSWIAFFELLGYYQDNNFFDEFYDRYRISHLDIDPSFPVEKDELSLIEIDLLGGEKENFKDWIDSVDVPNINPYLVTDKLVYENNDWVLLYGYVEQVNVENNRKMEVFLDSLCVKADQKKEIIQASQISSIGNQIYDVIPELGYVYANEIPDCDTYQKSNLTDVNLVIKKIKKKIPVGGTLFYKNGVLYAIIGEDRFKHGIQEIKGISKKKMVIINSNTTKIINEHMKEHFSLLLDEDDQNILEYHDKENNDKDIIKYEESEILVDDIILEKRIIEVLLPISRVSWSEFRSSLIHVNHVEYPCREITDYLNLKSKAQSYNLFNEDNSLATVTFCFGKMYHNYQEFTYIRKDLLKKYLSESNYELIWIVGGEKRFHSNELTDIIAKRDDPNLNHKLSNSFEQIIPFDDSEI